MAAGADVPGLVGTSCGPDCVAYVRGIREFENVFEDITPTVVYVDSYAGDDANDGSAESPIQTFAAAKMRWGQHGTRIKFRNGQVWSPLVFKPLASVTAAGCEVGEIVTTLDGKEAEILDVDGPTNAIVFRTTRTASGDLDTSDSITGTRSGCTLSLSGAHANTLRMEPIASGTLDLDACEPSSIYACDSAASFVSAGVQPGDCYSNSTEGPFVPVLTVFSETWLQVASNVVGNSAGDAYVIEPFCAGQLSTLSGEPGFDDRIVSLMEAEAPDAPQAELPLIDCNGGDIGGSWGVASGIFGVTGDGVGIAGVQNFRVHGCKTDLITQHHSAKVIALRIFADEIGNDEDSPANNCITTHNDGMAGAIASVCRSKPLVATSGATIAPTGICDDFDGTGCATQSGVEPEAFLWDIGSHYTTDLSSGLEDHYIMQSTGSNVMLLETRMVCESGSAIHNCNGPLGASGGAVPTDGYAQYFARTTVETSRPGAEPARCFRFNNAGQNGPMSFFLLNATIGGEGECNRGIEIDAGRSPTRVVGRNVVLQASVPCNTPEDGLVYTTAGLTSEDLVDLRGVYTHDDCWVFDGIDPGQTTDVDAVAKAINPDSAFLRIGSVLDAHDQFVTTPFECNPNRACADGAADPWSIPFSELHASSTSSLCLKDVVDGTICEFTGGTSHAGAVPEPSARILGGVVLLVIGLLRGRSRRPLPRAGATSRRPGRATLVERVDG